MRQAVQIQNIHIKKNGNEEKKNIFIFAQLMMLPIAYIFCFLFLFIFLLSPTTTYVYMYSVQSLKQAIERHHAIPADSQVLLVSGGETLNSSSRVCSYSAGTDDTNPIFMFINSLEPRNPPQPWPSIDNGMQHTTWYTKQCQINHFFFLPSFLFFFCSSLPVHNRCRFRPEERSR